MLLRCLFLRTFKNKNVNDRTPLGRCRTKGKLVATNYTNYHEFVFVLIRVIRGLPLYSQPIHIEISKSSNWCLYHLYVVFVDK
jgi:hypothetical protein